jgi:DNA-binding transcriptional MerR regulator
MVDVQRVCFIRKARNLGYTLSDIGLILNDFNKGQSPCPPVRKIIEQRINENKQRLQELQSLQTRMEAASVTLPRKSQSPQEQTYGRG